MWSNISPFAVFDGRKILEPSANPRTDSSYQLPVLRQEDRDDVGLVVPGIAGWAASESVRNAILRTRPAHNMTAGCDHDVVRVVGANLAPDHVLSNSLAQ